MSAARLFKSIFSKKNLRKIYIDRIRNSVVRGIDRVNPESLSNVLTDEIALIDKKVKSKTYRYTAYKEKLVSKGANGLPRVISIPTARDRIVLRGICELLSHTFADAVAEIPQVKIEALKEALTEEKFQEFVKIDLRQFYPSIPHDGILTTLKKRIRKPEILALIEGAITTPTVPESKGGKEAKRASKGVPQGLSISNILAEIFLSEFDAQMRAKSDIWYRRYVDDILILCPAGTSQKIAEEVCDVLEKHGVQPHRLNDEGTKSKVGSLNEEFEFLGYKVANRRLSIRQASLHKFEGALAKICTGYRHKLATARKPEDVTRAIELCQWRLNLRITGCVFEGKRLGWVFYFSQINDTSRLRAVDNTIGKLIDRFGLTGKIASKSSLKTFYETQRKNKADHRYIPNFDEMSTDERRKILSVLLGAHRIKGLSDKKVNELFVMKMSDAVRELEEDLASVS